jgi:hypothetical protein
VSSPPVLPYLVVTRDMRSSILTTANVMRAGQLLQRNVLVVARGGMGLTFARSQVFKMARDFLKKDVVRGLMIDDDIVVTDPAALARAIAEADMFDYNIVSPGRILTPNCPAHDFNEIVAGELRCTCYTQYMHNDPPKFTRYTALEVAKLQHFDRVELSGLGFYYGELPLAYRFKEQGLAWGEDLCFFLDNDLPLRHIDLRVRHLKTVLL